MNLLAATIATGVVAALLFGGLIAYRRDAIVEYVEVLANVFVVVAFIVLGWGAVYMAIEVLLREGAG